MSLVLAHNMSLYCEIWKVFQFFLGIFSLKNNFHGLNELPKSSFFKMSRVVLCLQGTFKIVQHASELRSVTHFPAHCPGSVFAGRLCVSDNCITYLWFIAGQYDANRVHLTVRWTLHSFLIFLHAAAAERKFVLSKPPLHIEKWFRGEI